MTHKNSSFSEILNFLINKCSQEVGSNSENIVSELAKQSIVTQKTVQAWLSGNNTKIRENSRIALAKYFSKYIPNIEPSWFEATSLDEFKKLFETSKERTISIIATDYKRIGTVEDDIKYLMTPSGVFYIYRYSFINTNKNGGRISKELLHIEKIDNELFCTYYFRTRGEDNENTLRTATGKVIPFDQNYCIFTVTRRIDENVTVRPRIIMIKKEPPHCSTYDYKFGIITSSSAVSNEPCSARIVLCNVNEGNSITNIHQFAQKNVKFLTANDFISINGDESSAMLEPISNELDPREKVLTISTENLRKFITNA